MRMFVKCQHNNILMFVCNIVVFGRKPIESSECCDAKTEREGRC